jgi:hypothetical protein
MNAFVSLMADYGFLNHGASVAAPGYWFLASPYTAHPDGLDAAAEIACVARAALIQAGVPVFSPIAHSHWVAKFGGLDPRSHALWLPAEAPFRRFARGIIVLRAAGWETSKGIRLEREEFARHGKPELLMNPFTVPEGLV